MKQKIPDAPVKLIVNDLLPDNLVRPGQSIVVDTGYLAAMSATCTMDIQSVRGVKNVLFGGEGLFNTVVTGPGKVLLQTMPINAVAGSIAPYIPSGGKN